MTPHAVGPVFVLVSLALVTWTVLSIQRDNRNLANIALLVLSLGSLAVTATLLDANTWISLTLLAAFASPLLAAVLAAALLWNGWTMLRREGRSLGNLLSLLAGIATIVVVGGCTTAMVLWPQALPVLLWLLLLFAWAGGLFVAYVVYGWLHQHLVRVDAPDFIVTLGSGLIGDRVPPLLARRIDRAIELYREERAAGRRPVLVMSGGKGTDELLSEAEAMSRYALERGVPADDLVREDASTTTEENLRNTMAMVRQDPRLGASAKGLAVTSNYHALRAAALARAEGAPVNVVSAPTAAYFWPSAVLREFVAVTVRSLPLQVAVALLVTLPLPLAFAWAVWLR